MLHPKKTLAKYCVVFVLSCVDYNWKREEVYSGAVRNLSSVLYSHNFTTYSSKDRTYCTVNDKTQYTVDSGEKEKGKTIVWDKLITFIPNAYCLLVINKTISNISQCMHRE